MGMRVAILASGGKDSTYASWWAQLQGWEVVSLVTVLVRGEDSMMFQLQNSWIAGFQAASMGISWKPVFSSGDEGVEINDLEMAIRGDLVLDEESEVFWPKGIERPEGLDIHSGPLDIDALVVGALRSDYQKTRIEMMCERLGVSSFCPLWHKDPLEHMGSLVEHGFEVIFTSVSTEGMDNEWIGKRLDCDSLGELRKISEAYRFNLDGEGGEFETIVLGSPHMSRRILIEAKSIWEPPRGSLEIKTCKLSINRYAQTGNHCRQS